MKIIFFTDYGVLERHTQVDTLLGALEMEKEAFQKAQIFAWIFFPIWIILAIIQAVCFVLSNGWFHPLAKNNLSRTHLSQHFHNLKYLTLCK